MEAGSPTSQFRGVSYYGRRYGMESQRRAQERKPWCSSIRVGELVLRKTFATEREAALQYDKWVLEHGLKRPLNILKKKA